MQLPTSAILLVVALAAGGCCLAQDTFDEEIDIGTIGSSGIGGGYRNPMTSTDDVSVVRHFELPQQNSFYRNPFTSSSSYSRSNYRNPFWARMMNIKFGGMGVGGGQNTRLETFFRTFLSWMTPAQKMELRQMKAMGAGRRELVRRAVDFFVGLPMGSDRQQKAVLLLQSACNRMAELVLGGRQNLWLLKKQVIHRNGGMVVSPVTMHRIVEQVILERIENMEDQQQSMDSQEDSFNTYNVGGYGNNKKVMAKTLFREYNGLCRLVARKEAQLLKLGYGSLWQLKQKQNLMGYYGINSNQGAGYGNSWWPWSTSTQKKWWQTGRRSSMGGYGIDSELDNINENDYSTTGSNSLGYGNTIDSLIFGRGGRKHNKFSSSGIDSSVEQDEDVMDIGKLGGRGYRHYYNRNPYTTTYGKYYGSNKNIFGSGGMGMGKMGMGMMKDEVMVDSSEEDDVTGSSTVVSDRIAKGGIGSMDIGSSTGTMMGGDEITGNNVVDSAIGEDSNVGRLFLGGRRHRYSNRQQQLGGGW